ncbi:MAG: four-carbon acid sugar kinase family protein [Bryobacteraceae bacterium]|nr:four-carbon acid sugar kinase family protein [Bryobacteraceae bacterium]
MSSSRTLLAAIADDYTGGSDMAGMLASQGVRTLQTFGQPDEETIHAAAGFDALIVSLKTRSIKPSEAVAQSIVALGSLGSLEPRQIQFKYCSTFDSTREGNIGPVASALMDALGTGFTIAVPALPINGRTQYLGYLFVNGVLLSESPLRHHPLNPMNEANLVRHLQVQTTREVGLIDLQSVRGGQSESDSEIALVDAIEDRDLTRIANAYWNLRFLTGASGITHALPSVWRERNLWSPQPPVPMRAADNAKALLIAGSCSAATLRQIEHWTGTKETMRTNVLDDNEVGRLVDVCERAWKSTDAILLYSSAPPNERISQLSSAIERAWSQVAQALAGSYGTLVVAGGETSGAVVEALGIRSVQIGVEIDPGVPALSSTSGPRLSLALKSGNFGSPDFFAKAVAILSNR